MGSPSAFEISKFATELKVTFPARPRNRAGLDALTQLIEPYVSVKANPLTDAFCRDGIPLAARSLPAVCRNGRDAEARAGILAS